MTLINSSVPWLRGRKAIMQKCNCSQWETVEKLLALGAPIAKVGGSWLAVDCLLDAWLGEVVSAGVFEKTGMFPGENRQCENS